MHIEDRSTDGNSGCNLTIHRYLRDQFALVVGDKELAADVAELAEKLVLDSFEVADEAAAAAAAAVEVAADTGAPSSLLADATPASTSTTPVIATSSNSSSSIWGSQQLHAMYLPPCGMSRHRTEQFSQ